MAEPDRRIVVVERSGGLFDLTVFPAGAESGVTELGVSAERVASEIAQHAGDTETHYFNGQAGPRTPMGVPRAIQDALGALRLMSYRVGRCPSCGAPVKAGAPCPACGRNG